MHRWIARLLVMVMLVPAFGPLAMARVSPSMGPHCQRQAAKPAMPCHHGMTMAPEPSSSEPSFRALDSCCQNHACCRGIATLRWAKPAGQLSGHVELGAETVFFLPGLHVVPTLLSNRDSARAPPRV